LEGSNAGSGLAPGERPSSTPGRAHGAQRSGSIPQPPPPPSDELQPGVWEFIANTYLAHAAEFPDPNETVEVLRLYLEGNKLLYEGQINEA